jgi:membrane protease YdiL (CAAX protease family)
MHYLENILGQDNSFWKYLVVILVTFVAIQIIGSIVGGIIIIVYLLANKDIDFAPEMFVNVKSLADLGLPENLILVVALFPSVVGAVTSWMLIQKMHHRPFSATVNGREHIRWNHLFAGFLFWTLLMIIFLATNYIISPDNFVLQFDSRKFIPLLIIALLFIPFQTTLEEYIFRGYIAQGIAAWTKNRWLVISIPGLLFGLMHYQNTEVVEHGFWVAMPPYIIFGLFFGLLAVLDDGIELPLGIHAANNIFTCLFVTNPSSSLQTPAIFEQQIIYHIPEIVGLLAATSVTVWYFHRKYAWKLNILNTRIEAPNKDSTISL